MAASSSVKEKVSDVGWINQHRYGNTEEVLVHPQNDNCKQNSRIPANRNTTTITLLLKPDKDPTLPSSYRLLSLLKTDIQITSKALITRIETFTPHIIHQDQTGFIKGRHASNNTHRLFDLIHHISNKKEETLIRSLYAEKAFGKLNWNFFFTTLKKIGFTE